MDTSAQSSSQRGLKYYIITYGCQMNTADSEEMAQPLQERGLIATARPQDADIIIMNTCTVRDQAEHRAKSNLGRLREWKEANPQRILIVAGCAASRWGDSIQKRYPFIDAVSPATRIEEFPELIAQILKERWNWDTETASAFETENRSMGKAEQGHIPISPMPRITDSNLFGDEHTAHVTIMRGCNYSCSYCIVPQVRGREVYRPMPDILEEIQRKTTEGYREVMLLGQTVNSYHYRIGVSEYRGVGVTTAESVLSDTPIPRNSDTILLDFADLLRAISEIPQVERIRFMSPHPRHMRPRVIEAMKDSPKVCRHIHLPVQSGSDRLLEHMKRLYTREDYLHIVHQLRASMPGILITTDIIVGYPGETDQDLTDTMQLMRDVRFDGLFAFKFSPRPGTPAAQVHDDVPNAVKEERLQRVLALNQQLKQCQLSHSAI